MLVDVIIPSIIEEVGDADVLFVGVEWYTAEYVALFPAGHLVTVDINPDVARYGSPRHQTVDVRRLTEVSPPHAFAAIVCNGVLGYGVNDADDVLATLVAMRTCLRNGGLLVLGFNDIDGRRPDGLEAAVAGARLVQSAGAGLPVEGSGPLGPLRHVYIAYRR
jgi:hypothetical protein